MWREGGSLLFTDISVRILSERHINLCLLPLDRSLRSSNLRHGLLDGWTSHAVISFAFFFTLFIACLFIHLHGKEL